MYVSFSPWRILAASIILLFPLSAQAAGSHGGGHGRDSGASQGHKSGGSQGHHSDGGDGHHAKASNIGQPGKASEASRTIEIEMTENRYSTEKISVAKGETIRFIIRNKGELVHEFNIGTRKTHAAHQKEMMTMVEHGVLEADKINHDKMKMDMGGGKTMEHNDPNSVLLEPGKSGEVIWKFTKSAELEFACNVPGHYDAGMVGELHVK